jgi:prepilin-type N-terminal cleavage/methylation domain-containing protein
MRRSGRHGRAGFTLLEVMLAMTSLAMLTAIIYAAFHLGTRAVERGQASVVTAQRLRAASDVLIRQVKSVDPYCSRSVEDGEYPYFFGNDHSMTFVTAAGQLGGGGLVRVCWVITDDPPGLQLTESAAFSPDALGKDDDTTDCTGPHATVVDGFRRARFQYLYRESNESKEDQEWRGSWDARDDGILPAAVQVEIEGLPGFGGDVWGTEIPIMTSHYREGGAECDPDRIGQPIQAEEGEGTSDAAASTPGANGGDEEGAGGANDDGSGVDDDGEEADE